MQRPEPVTDLDWDAGRARDPTERMLSVWGEMLSRIDELPPGRVDPAPAVAAVMQLPIPDQPLDPSEIERLMRTMVMDHSAVCGHPGFLAYVSGAGTAPGAAADLLAAGLNPNVGGWVLSPAATELELHLMAWMGRLFGLPEGAGGLIDRAAVRPRT